MLEENPSVVKKSICQSSFTAPFHNKSRGSIGLSEMEFKSITTFIGLNFLYCNDLSLVTKKTLGQ
jgi:hypothetical protein